jgi:hypothetical protein
MLVMFHWRVLCFTGVCEVSLVLVMFHLCLSCFTGVCYVSLMFFYPACELLCFYSLVFIYNLKHTLGCIYINSHPPEDVYNENNSKISFLFTHNPIK